VSAASRSLTRAAAGSSCSHSRAQRGPQRSTHGGVALPAPARQVERQRRGAPRALARVAQQATVCASNSPTGGASAMRSSRLACCSSAVTCSSRRRVPRGGEHREHVGADRGVDRG
jgi:hypothetical protein